MPMAPGMSTATSSDTADLAPTPSAEEMEPGARHQRVKDMKETREHMHLTPTPQVASGDTKPKYRRGIVAVAAALIVAALFAVAFQLVSGIRPRQQAPTPTRAPLVGGWQLAGQFP